MPTEATTLGKTIEELCAFRPAAGRRLETAALVAFEDRYKPALDLLDRASQLDASGWDDADRPKPQSMDVLRPRSLAAVNAVRIARLACTGDGAAAAAALLSTLRLRRVLTMSFYASLPMMQAAHGLQSLLTFTSPNPVLLQKIQKSMKQQQTACARETAAVLTRQLAPLRESRRLQRPPRWLRGAENYPHRRNRQQVGAAAARSRAGCRASRVRRGPASGTTALASEARCRRGAGEKVPERSLTIEASRASGILRASVWIAFGQFQSLDRCCTRRGSPRAYARKRGGTRGGEISARARWRVAGRTP